MAKYNILRDDDEFLAGKEDKTKKEMPDQSAPAEENEAAVFSEQEEVVEEEAAFHFEPEGLVEEEPAFSPEPEEAGETTPQEDILSDDVLSTTDSEKEESMLETLREHEEAFSSEEESGIDETVPPIESETGPAAVEAERAESEYQLGEEKKEIPDYYYEEDYKQEKLNYKPIIIGIGIVAAIVILFFVISNLFFGEDAVEPEEQKVETAAERMQREQAERKNNFLVNLSQSTGHKLSSIHMLANLDQSHVKYSSILLYGNTLDLEVFAPDRAALAKFNLKIKNSEKIKDYKIDAVDQRPGSEGGLFALYDINLAGIDKSPSAASQKITTVSPSSWATAVPQQTGLSLASQRQISSKKENLFTVNRYEYVLKGSLKNCLSLVNHMTTTSPNLSVHKLALLPTDQRKMSASSYMLKLLIDFYQ